MRKCYVEDVGHDRALYWDEYLNKTDIDKIFNFSYNKYLPKFDRFIPNRAKILEGGCGLGQYVHYYTERDFSVDGVDYSENLIKKASQLNKKARFQTADIRKLPFEEKSFDVYLLNGVLEHFEEGLEIPLREAERVLVKGGILIATLQYLNIARAMVDCLSLIPRFIKRSSHNERMKSYRGANIKGTYKLVKSCAAENRPHFHSYFFNQKEARDLFKKFNFEIIHVNPLSVENGLGDFAIFRTLLSRLKKTDKGHVTQKNKMPQKHTGNVFKEWLKKTFIQEEPKDLLGFCLLRMLQACFGSMILVVCRKK